MGALLGMVLGAGLGYEKNRIARQREVEDKTVDMISQAALQDPSILQDKEMRGLIEKRRSKDYASVLDHIGMFTQKANAGFPASPGMGGNPSMQPVDGRPSGPQMQPAMATGQARNYGPHESQGDLNDPNTWFKHIQDVRAFAAQFPGNAQLQARAQQEVADSQKHLEDLRAQQNYEQTKAQQQQFHEDTQADRQTSRAEMAESRAQSLAERRQARADAEAARQQAEQDRQSYRDSMVQLQKERDTDKREQQTATFAKNLDAGRDKLLADFAKLPDAAKANAKPRVDAYNSSVSQFYRKHAGDGAPTLLKWNEGKKGSLGGYVGFEAPTIEAIAPQYVTDPKSGKSGWMDADGNLYVDAH